MSPVGSLAGLKRRLASLDTDLRERPDDIELLRHRADVLRLLGEDNDALGCLDAILKRRPHDHQALIVKADLLEVSGELEGALAALEEAGADDVDTLLRLAELNRRLGRMEAFHRILEDGLVAHHRDPRIREVRSLALGPDAVDEVSLDELAGLMKTLWSIVRERPSERDELEARLERCQVWDPHHPGIDDDFDPWCATIRLLRTEERDADIRPVVHDGLDFCDEVLRRYPDQSFVLKLKGRLLLELGWAGDALHAFERALEVEPFDARARRGRDHAADLMAGLRDNEKV
ncbi:MAG: tetratricopeptide repeat protein [Methanopyri archaeon]|nr:tetratricopeptide repeat protein [Methanopyri archaeon]